MNVYAPWIGETTYLKKVSFFFAKAILKNEYDSHLQIGLGRSV